MEKTLKLPATQTSLCGTMKLAPSVSPFDDQEIWWALMIKAPSGMWVLAGAGPAPAAYWMASLGFNPWLKA